MELSTRDRVALANYTEIIEGRGGPNGGVFLDISHRSKEYILEKLPRMYEQFMESQGLDISQEPMEVAPTAHYTMGGVVVESDTHATAVTGLYAAGETTAGLHGANRLGGNSLAETVVFGRHAGESAATYVTNVADGITDATIIERAHKDMDQWFGGGAENAVDLLQNLRDVMWETCGVVRNEERLRAGLGRLRAIKNQLRDVNVATSEDLAHLLDLRASIISSEATLLGAIERRESRGAHQRTDYPEVDEALAVNFITKLDEHGRLVLTSRAVPAIPDDLLPWLDDEEFEIEGRLLE
ncbi:MAG: FAD-binding protein, partial [Chloroflexota bacterium]